MPYIGRSEKFGVRNRFYYTQASGGATSISGNDDAGKGLSFTDGAYVDVALNGVTLVAGTDYNTTTANTIAGLSALSAGDSIEILVYDVFNVADTVSATSGGTFSGGVAVTGDLTVDTTTLKVDSTNNRVGVGTASPTNGKLEVTNSSSTVPAGYFKNTSASGDSPSLTVQGGANNAAPNFSVLDYAGNKDFVVRGDGVTQLGSASGSTNTTGVFQCGGISQFLDNLRVVSTLGDDPAYTDASSPTGVELTENGFFVCVTNQQAGVRINRTGNDGSLVNFYQAGNAEGSISVNGSTVSYNGGHLSRWSQLADNTRDTNIVKGTVLTNLDKMAEWTTGGVTESNEQLNCMAVSSVEGDANVAGVFVNWDDDDDLYHNDMNVAMTGDMIIRIAEGTTVARGDLLMSAGDGTAKPQGDDIVRGKTIAKVTSTYVSHTYDDGSYLVPCVLMAC